MCVSYKGLHVGKKKKEEEGLVDLVDPTGLLRPVFICD